MVWENYLMFCDYVSKDLILLWIIGVLKIWFIFGLVWGLVFNIDFMSAFKSEEYWVGILA